MLNPYDQGQLLLSFAEERRQDYLSRRASHPGRRRHIDRLLNATGERLIRIGSALRRYGGLELPAHPATPYMEMN